VEVKREDVLHSRLPLMTVADSRGLSGQRDNKGVGTHFQGMIDNLLVPYWRQQQYRNWPRYGKPGLGLPAPGAQLSPGDTRSAHPNTVTMQSYLDKCDSSNSRGQAVCEGEGDPHQEVGMLPKPIN